MKTSCTFLFFVLTAFFSQAQNLVSIIPNSGTAGNALTSQVTASGMYFMTASPPGVHGIKLSNNNCNLVTGTNVQVVDDDHVNVDFVIPINATNGMYDVILNTEANPNTSYTLPAGFSINGGIDRSLQSATPGIANAGSNLTLAVSGQNIQSMINSGNFVSKLQDSTGFIIPGTNVIVIDPDNITIDFAIPLWADNSYYDLKITCDAGCFNLNQTVQIQGGLPRAIISIQPNQTAAGSALTAQITARYLYFMSGSPVGISTIVLETTAACPVSRINGQNINVIDDDHADADFSVPSSAINGFYNVNLTMNDGSSYQLLPQGFEVTGGITRDIVSINPNQGNRGEALTAHITAQNLHFMVSTQSGILIEFNNNAGASFTVPQGVSNVIDSDHVDAPVNIPFTVPHGLYDVNLYHDGCTYTLPLGFEVLGNVISGKVYFDADSNGIQDVNEIGFPGKRLLLLPDSVIAITDQYGNYYFTVDSGSYSVQFVPDTNWVLTSLPSIYNLSIANTDSAGNNFGINPIDDEYNIFTSITGGYPHCNWNVNYTCTYTNLSTAETHGTITWAIDPDLTFVSSLPPPDQITGDTLIWNYDSLHVGETRNIIGTVHMPSPGGSDILSSACAEAFNQSGTLVFSGCDSLHQIVLCAFDPNDKSVEPEGEGPSHAVLRTSDLDYLVRFQNTGNDTAFMVMILDTIDPSLDLNTLVIVSSSHTVETIIRPGRVVEFRFNNILLPDSNVDELNSHGFVKYRIHPVLGVQEGTVVTNIAHIYFDLNNAVTTNGVEVTLVTTIGIAEIISAGESLIIYPDPVTDESTIRLTRTLPSQFDLLIVDALGRIAETQHVVGSSAIIRKKNYNSGLYFVIIHDIEHSRVLKGKFVIQ